MNKENILNLFQTRHKIKSFVLKKTFKKTNIYKQIINDTKSYDIFFKKLTIFDRLFILRYNIPIKNCLVCNKPFINIDGKILKNCKCKIYQNKNERKIKNIKDYFLKNYKKIFIKNKNDIENLILYIKKHKNFNFNKLLYNHLNAVAEIVKCTEEIIPFNSIKDFYLIKRIYHFVYNLSTIPKCNICLKPLIFKNFSSGYLSCSCNKNKIELPTHIDIFNYLKQTNYTWLNINSFKNLHDTSIKLYCNSCKHEFQYTFTDYKLIKKLKICCPNCNFTKNITQQERLNEFIKSLGFNTIMNFKLESNKKHTYECDIFIPELKIRYRI